MGVLTDLILATEDELLAVDEGDLPINVLPGLDIKGTGLVELATLYGIVTGREFDPDLKAFPAVGGQDSEDGPWVFRCPDELIQRLAAAAPAEIARIAADWTDTEEIQQAGWQPHETSERLLEIRAFARQAVEARKPVHIWTSL